MDLHLNHVKDDMKLQVTISYFSGHTFDLFNVRSQVEPAPLKIKLSARFQPINKVEIFDADLTCSSP